MTFTEIILSLVLLVLLGAVCFREKKLTSGEGVFHIPKDAKYIKVSVYAGGSGGSGRGQPGKAVTTLAVPDAEFKPQMEIEVVK